MSSKLYTVDQDTWLKENYHEAISYDDLTRRFNQTFSCSKTKCGVAQRCSKFLGLKGLSTKHHYTAEEDEWLRENYDGVETYVELANRFNLYFSVNRTRDQVRERCNKVLGLKGKPSHTSYRYRPKEQLPVGSIRKSQTATYIKVLEVPNGSCFTGYSEPYWSPLQKKIYQDAYGPIEPGQMVCFLDGEHDNFALDNLYPIDRRISALLTKNKWWTKDGALTLTAIKWCELYYAVKDMKGE